MAERPKAGLRAEKRSKPLYGRLFRRRAAAFGLLVSLAVAEPAAALDLILPSDLELKEP